MRPTSTVGFALVSLFLFPSSGFAQADIPGALCDDSPEAVERDEASLRETIHESLLALLIGPERDSDGVEDPTGALSTRVRDIYHRLEKLESSIEIEYMGPGTMEPIPPAAVIRLARTSSTARTTRGPTSLPESLRSISTRFCGS